MKKITLFLFATALCAATAGPSAAQTVSKLQDLYDLMEDPAANFYEVQKAANTYYQTHSKEKGSGYKQFKRWEAEMQYWIDEQGNRLDPQFVYAEAKKFEEQQAGQKGNAVASVTWSEMGPRYWNGTSTWAPGLGRIDAIEVDLQNSNHILIGSPEGGVWKTLDGGATWNSLTDGLAYMRIGDVSIDPVNSNTYYIGTVGAGMLKSTNGGASFTQINSGLSPTSTIKKIIVDPVNPNNVYIAASTGIFRSTNGGTSWTQSSTGSFYDIEFKPGTPSTIYACGTAFYRSTNSGASFSKITSGIIYTSAMRLAVTAADPNVVYVVQCNSSVFGALYKSTDSGISFTATVTGNSANGTNYFGYSPAGTDNSGQGSYNIDITVSPVDPNEVHIGGIITWKSTNGGMSFTATTEWDYPNTRGYTHCDMHALEFAGNTLYTGSDGGIFKSTDNGNNFTNISDGLGLRMFYRLGLSLTDPGKVACGAQDNGSSILNASGWIDWLGADGMEAIIDNTNPNIIYGSSQDGTLYKTTNGGNSYSGITEPESSGDWTTPFLMDPVTPNTLYAGFTDVYKSTNGGSTWTQISNFGSTSYLKHLAIAPSNPNYLYAARGTSIYRTTDGGATWTSIANGLNNLSVNRISVHNSDPNKVAVAMSGSRIYASTDGGNSWVNITANFPAVTARCILYENGANEGLYVGTNTGVYYTNNAMTNWVTYQTSLPKVPVNELEIQYTVGKLRAATYGRGIWEVDQYGSTVDVPGTETTALSLSVYPNPSNVQFHVSVGGDKNTEYVLQVENILGQVIYSERATAEEIMSNPVILQAVNKGIYILRLKGNGAEGHVKIVVQ